MMINKNNFVDALNVDRENTIKLISLSTSIERNSHRMYEMSCGNFTLSDVENGTTISHLERKELYLKKLFFETAIALNKSYHEVTGKYFMRKEERIRSTYERFFFEADSILDQLAA